MLPGNRFTSKSKHIGDRNAASYRGGFRFACVQDSGCRGTSRGGALSVFLMQGEGGGTVGFGAGGGFVQVGHVVLAFVGNKGGRKQPDE